MDYSEAHRSFACLSLGIIGVLPFTSCTSTSNLSNFSKQNIQAVAKIAQEEPATSQSTTVNLSEVQTPAGDQVQTPAGDQIVGSTTTPASIDPVALKAVEPADPADPADPVAVKKPAPSSAPMVLASVPRTPVVNRPTNQIMMVRTTAYSHLEADSLQYGKLSAAGNKLQYGSHVRSAAADWSKYPLGTRFVIEGLPYEYVVDDYGSALVGTETIDIYKPDMSTMGKWGVRNVPVRVLEWGSFEESRKILDGRKHVRHADHVREMLREIERKGRTGYATRASVGSA